MRFILGLSLLVGACATDPDVVVENAGELRIELYGSGELQVTVRHRMNSCDPVEQAFCEVRRVDSFVESTDLVIESRLSWNTDREVCPRMVQFATATCVAPALAEGSYSVAFGDARAELVIPDGTGLLLDTSLSAIE